MNPLPQGHETGSNANPAQTGNTEVVTGVRDFQGQRLHILQIGLGTFGTVVQNLTDPKEGHHSVDWLMEGVSETTQSLRSVSVEPVPEHVETLRPALKKLPNSALVQAAIVRQGQSAAVHAIDPEVYKACLREVKPVHVDAFMENVLFLRNMSCVGREHPDMKDAAFKIEERFGVKVTVQAIEAEAFTYGALTDKLSFGGVEVLMIDAEGHDCQILLSMIDHCTAPGNHDHWPDIVQFETMGHSDKIYGEGSEVAIIRELESHGYTVAHWSPNDTQMVRTMALYAESRIEGWADVLLCDYCWVRGAAGIPFRTINDTVCWNCGEVIRWLGYSAFNWDKIGPVLLEDEYVHLMDAATDGNVLWAVGCDGRLFRYSGGAWDCLSERSIKVSESAGDAQAIRTLKEVAVSEDRVWAVDSIGCLLRGGVNDDSSIKWEVVHRSSQLRHLSISNSGSGLAIWCSDEALRIRVYLPAEDTWCEVSGAIGRISVSADGKHVWGVNPVTSEIFHCNGMNGNWEFVGGSLRHIFVSGDGCHVWGLNSRDEIYYRPGLGGPWVRVPGSLAHLCVSVDGEKVWGIDPCGHLWACSLKRHEALAFKLNDDHRFPMG